jgi:hypothetical protein
MLFILAALATNFLCCDSDDSWVHQKVYAVLRDTCQQAARAGVYCLYLCTACICIQPVSVYAIRSQTERRRTKACTSGWIQIIIFVTASRPAARRIFLPHRAHRGDVWREADRPVTKCTHSLPCVDRGWCIHYVTLLWCSLKLPVCSTLLGYSQHHQNVLLTQARCVPLQCAKNCTARAKYSVMVLRVYCKYKTGLYRTFRPHVTQLCCKLSFVYVCRSGATYVAE